MIWMQLRKVRKNVSISGVNRLDLVELVIEKGFGS